MKRVQKLQIALYTTILSLLIACLLLYNFYDPKPAAAAKSIDISADTAKLASLEDFNNREEDLTFFENKGQFNSKQNIRYMVEANGVSCFLKPDGIMYAFTKLDNKEGQSRQMAENTKAKAEISLLTMSWKGANPHVRIRAEEQAQEVRNYYTTGTAEGITGVKSYKKIVYEEIYKNIDLIFYTQTHTLKYDFVVKPGGNVEDIQLVYSGDEGLQLSKGGELLIEGQLGNLKEGKPYTYQTLNGTKEEISSQYRINGSTVGFEVSEYDQNENLIIDPTLLWATYYGGESQELGYATCTDKWGNVYMAGVTSSTNFIASNMGYDISVHGERDAFLVKFDASGNRLWATYYGGFGGDRGAAVCTDPSGNVYLAGFTESTTDIAYLGHDNVYNEHGDNVTPEYPQYLDLAGDSFDKDAFLVKFTKDGARVWGTYYGGEEGRSDQATGVCSDANGNIFLTGVTNSSTGIAHNGHDNIQSGASYDAFLVKFSNGGVRQWATYFGGTKDDRANAVSADPWGNLYIAGHTESVNFMNGGHNSLFAGKRDAFLAMFGNSGTHHWSTYYGGNDEDEATSVAADASGIVYLAGVTKSNSGISHLAHDATYNGAQDAFMAKFSFAGIRLWGTYYGGTGREANTSVCVSKNGDVYLGGMTESATGIATNNGYDPTFNSGRDGYLVRFNSAGQRQWGSYYGGGEDEYVYGVTTDISANVYIVGESLSEEGIAHNGFQNDKRYSYDAILAKFNPYDTGGGPGGPSGEGGVSNGSPARNRRVSSKGENTPAAPAVRIYPNPASETLQVHIGNSSDTGAYLEVFTMAGQKVYEASFDQASDLSIDVRQWSKGMYILKTHTLSGISSEKVLVQ